MITPASQSMYVQPVSNDLQDPVKKVVEGTGNENKNKVVVQERSKLEKAQHHIQNITVLTGIAAVIAGIGSALLLITSDNGLWHKRGEKLSNVYAILEMVAIAAVVTLVAIKVTPYALALLAIKA
ncbi:MAG: hypothetical protein H0W88_02060 [Parachlamydiaceae bacterium]|nr:hypothetical protein [Parachlamydiaceae bacterium]